MMDARRAGGQRHVDSVGLVGGELVSSAIC